MKIIIYNLIYKNINIRITDNKNTHECKYYFLFNNKEYQGKEKSVIKIFIKCKKIINKLLK